MPRHHQAISSGLETWGWATSCTLEPCGPGLAHSYFRDPQTLLRFS